MSKPITTLTTTIQILSLILFIWGCAATLIGSFADLNFVALGLTQIVASSVGLIACQKTEVLWARIYLVTYLKRDHDLLPDWSHRDLS